MSVDNEKKLGSSSSTSPATKDTTRGGVTSRLRLASTIFGSLYLTALLLLMVPFVQTHTLYLNALKFPFFAKFDRPEDYGLAPGKTLNFYIPTYDNVSIGSWFVLADPTYLSLRPFPPSSPPSLPTVQTSLKTHPTILFLHGNAATRAFSVRIAHYQAYASRLSSNVLAIDYRGYADSSGVPSEKGLTTDARAAWNWILDNGGRGENVLIVGHSLGTAVAARLAAELSGEGLGYKGVVLLSPFSSIETLLHTYSVLGLFPVMKPLTFIPGAHGFVARALIHKFNTLDVITNITGNTLIAHAEDDPDIPHNHADALFEAVLAPHLPGIDSPPSSPLEWTAEERHTFTAQSQARKEATEKIVSRREIYQFGVAEEVLLNGGKRKVVNLKTHKGVHDRLGIQEGVQDVMRVMFEF